MIDGALIEVEGRPALRFARPMQHSAERVWRAITEPTELAQWFVAPVQWKPELGERWEAAGHTGEITALVEPSQLAWTWGSEKYSFEIVPAGEKCLLVFTHVFTPEFGPPDQHAAGWETYFSRLDSHLEGGYLSEEKAHDPFERLQAEYRELFASNQLPVELKDGVLRLKRYLAHPIERVWRAITDPSELANWFPQDEPLQVTESNEPRLLIGTWFGDPLRFELEPADDGGCRLTFTHEFGDPDTSARTAAGWDRCFARLDGQLRGSPITEGDALGDWPAIHERYAEAFDVDPQLGRESWASRPSNG